VRYNDPPIFEKVVEGKKTSMPVYTYRCTNCGIQFDQQQSFSDEPLIRCPECGKKTLKKVYQPVGIVFKGSGFYATDHHSPSGQSPKKDERVTSEDDKKVSTEKSENVSEKKPSINAEKPTDSK
jgi:putative FmdB family regulatory protein